jgi:hypothetical protein
VKDYIGEYDEILALAKRLQVRPRTFGKMRGLESAHRRFVSVEMYGNFPQSSALS